MFDLDIYYVRAKNFLCFGPEGIELDLRNLGRIVHIRGINLDITEEDSSKPGSNGSGKSAIPDIIAFTIFGYTVRDLKKKSVIHNKVGKELETEVRWGDYRVVRTQKPDSLRLWESKDHIWDKSTELTKGKGTQALILEKIGMSYETLVNTILFTDDLRNNFLECDTPTKRLVVENVLSLGPYRDYLDKAKEKRKEIEKQIESLAKDYQRLTIELESSQSRVVKISQQEQEWITGRKAELAKLIAAIKAKQEMLKKSDVGAALAKYNDAQDRIKTLTDSIPDYEEKISKVRGMVEEINGKIEQLKTEKNKYERAIQKLAMDMDSKQAKIAENDATIESFVSKTGQKCPNCLGQVKEENYAEVVNAAKAQNEVYKAGLAEIEGMYATAQKKLSVCQGKLSQQQSILVVAQGKDREFSDKIVAARKEIAALAKIEKPDAGADEKVIQAQIEELKKQALAKKAELDGETPFLKMLNMAKEESEQKAAEVAAKKTDLQSQEAELPYYEFWVKAFGDNGIRKFVIDGILPAFNNRIAYWLQYLINNKIRLTFDNELSDLIEANPQDGRSFIYAGMSRGQKQRLNLAVSQSFAHVATLNAGVNIPLVFLDEVATNIDPVGVEGIYRMIQELAKTKQVFVTTHDRGLQELLMGCDEITLVHKDGFTTLKT